jgi:hypothetical protein
MENLRSFGRREQVREPKGALKSGSPAENTVFGWGDKKGGIMKKAPVTHLTLIVSVLAIAPVFSSLHAGWTRTYGGAGDDVGYCVQETSDAGYVVSGYCEAGRLWLLKIDEEGDTLWTTNLFDEPGGKVYSVQQTSDGGYIVTGYLAITFDGKYHLCLFKTDASGNTLWSRWDSDWFSEPDSTGGVGLSVQETFDGGYIITGYRSHWYEYVDDLWLIKTDSLGSLLWTRTYGGEAEDCGHCVRQTADGGYIISGYSESLNSLWILKTDEAGDTMWTQSSPFWINGKGYYVQETSDGGYIVTGSVAPMYDGKDHLILIKTDSDGDTLLTRLDTEWLPSGGGAVGHCVQETPDEDYIITGCTSEQIGVINDLVLIKTDEAGDTLWTRIYGGEEADVGYSLDQTSEGGFIITGATKSFGAGEYDLWLLKTDANGDTLSVVEKPVDEASNWHILIPIGNEIVLRYSNCPQGFHASVFDASGRKVDELHSPDASGTITWPVTPVTRPVTRPVTPITHHSPGVYFIRLSSERSIVVRKVILVR